MGYKAHQFRVATRKQFAEALYAFLENAGWTLHDTGGGVKAQAYLSVSGQPANGTSVTLGSNVYTFKSALTPTEGQVLIGGSTAETLDNLKLAVNRTDPGTNDGVKYKIAAAHPDCQATTNTDTTQYFEQFVEGQGTIVVSNTWAACSWPWSFVNYGTAAWRVYTSCGESGDEPPGYVYLWDNHQSNGIFVRAYQYWDAAAHTGTRRAYWNNNETYTMIGEFNSSYDCLIAGDKDLVYLNSHILSTGNQTYAQATMFGHLPGRFHPEITRTTDAISNGSNVNVPVVSSAGFVVGQEIQILGVTEGCEKITVSSIPDTEHIIFETIAGTYATGAYLGMPASVFGWYSGNATYFNPCSYMRDTGLTVSTSGYSPSPLSPMYTWNQTQEKRYMATHLYMAVNGYCNIGHYGDNFICVRLSTTNDVAIKNEDGSTPFTGTVTSATSLSMTDNDRSWEVNELVGKFVILTANAGIGQVRKITANDATSITIGSAWITNPDSQTAYKIADTVFRGLHYSYTSAQMGCIRLDEDSVPTLPT